MSKSELAGVFNPFTQKVFLASDINSKEAVFVLFHELHHWKRFVTDGNRLFEKSLFLTEKVRDSEETHCSREARIDEREFQRYLAGQSP